MARLNDMVESQRSHIESLSCPTFPQAAFSAPRPLSKCRVALISSAGLMRRNDENVSGNSDDYRRFDKTCQNRDILINHLSINFDRTAFAEDANSVLPKDILKSMAEDDTIERASDTHYSFMGATAPELLQKNAERLAQELTDLNINTVCLLPV